MNLNKVLLIGRLTQEVDFRYLPSGSSLANLSIATNRIYKDKSGNTKEEVEYHRVVVWGKLAELCHRHLNKGRLIFIEGRIRSRNWLDSQGNKKISYEIIAEDIKFGPKSVNLGTEKELEEIESELDIYKPGKENESDEFDVLNISY